MFDGDDDSMRIAREETFGPVMSVFMCSGHEEVLARVNALSIEDLSASATKRSASRKLLFPEPFGPTRNESCASETSQAAMLL